MPAIVGVVEAFNKQLHLIVTWEEACVIQVCDWILINKDCCVSPGFQLAESRRTLATSWLLFSFLFGQEGWVLRMGGGCTTIFSPFSIHLMKRYLSVEEDYVLSTDLKGICQILDAS